MNAQELSMALWALAKQKGGGTACTSARMKTARSLVLHVGKVLPDLSWCRPVPCSPNPRARPLKRSSAAFASTKVLNP